MCIYVYKNSQKQIMYIQKQSKIEFNDCLKTCQKEVRLTVLNVQL